jgi:site-specific recombinase XerD
MPLTDTAVKTLAELQRIRHLHSAFVFCDKKGKPYSPSQVSVAFKRASRKAGIENLRFHDLRHDFASNLVQGGVDIYKVKELLGHKDLRMTVRYCHLAPENLRCE